MSKIDYTLPKSWDVIWSRPYSNYEKHHQLFWGIIRKRSQGFICDLGVGSGSCWRGTNASLVGVDFSYEACREAADNCPFASFVCCDLVDTPLDSHVFDTVVVSGVVNYYEDLTALKKEVQRLVKPGGTILVTINVITDFPSRTWNPERIQQEFEDLGTVESEFYPMVGYFIAITAK